MELLADTTTARRILDEGERAIPDRDPWFIRWRLEWLSRDFAAALNVASDADSLNHAEPGRVVPATELRGMALALLGREGQAWVQFDSARAYLERGVMDYPEDLRLQAALSRVLAWLGRPAEAVALAEEAGGRRVTSRDITERTFGLADLARTYAIAGEEEKAIDAIDRVMALPFYWTVALLRADPMWDPLRDNPRFQELLEKYAELVH